MLWLGALPRRLYGVNWTTSSAVRTSDSPDECGQPINTIPDEVERVEHASRRVNLAIS